MPKHFQLFTSAAERKGSNSAALPSASSRREHPAEPMPSQRCATKGVAAAAGRDLGFYLGRPEPVRR
jgi:hypothetical protein